MYSYTFTNKLLKSFLLNHSTKVKQEKEISIIIIYSKKKQKKKKQQQQINRTFL